MRGTICGCIIGIALLFSPQEGRAVSFTVDSASVGGGNTFAINLHVTDVVKLTSWQFDLAYDPSILHANWVTEGPFLSSAGTTLFIPGVIDNTAGLISLVAASFMDLSPPSGSGVLAAVHFTALRSGISPLTASNVFLDFSNSGFTITNGSVGVSEPSTALLLGLGALLFGGRRRWT